MATSGSKSVSVTSYDTLKFSWQQQSQSIPDNATTIIWSLELIAKTNGKIISSTKKAWSVTVNGIGYSGKTSIAINDNETITLASGTTTIPHNADGSKTFSYSFSQTFDITFGGSNISTKTGSGTGTLDSIAQKSTLSVSDGVLGQAQVLTITRAATTLTHKLYYTCGSKKIFLLGESSPVSNTSVTLTAPVSLASQNATGSTLSITFVLETYAESGTKYVGANQYTRTFTIPENSSLLPACSITVSDAAGYANSYAGNYIQGMSKLSVSVSTSAKEGGYITSTKVTANDTIYTSTSFTTDVIKTSASTTTVTAEVTDQRGYKGTASKTVNVWAYSAPKITKLTVARWNTSTNEEDENGTAIRVTYSGTITPLSNYNGHVWELQYKKSSETAYTKQTLNNTSYSLTDSTYTITGADTESSYDIRLVVSDNFYNGTTAIIMSTSVSTAYTIMDFGADGKSVAFGKVAEESDLLDVGFRFRTYKGILQPVLEDGADFDKLLTPNTYTLRNAKTANYLNVPDDFKSTNSTGTLRIESCGISSQLRQVITLCNSPKPQEYERFYYLSSESTQRTWFPWKRKLEVVLYDNSTGSNGTITLSETAENFKYLEIFFIDNGNRTGGYTKVYSPNGNTVCLSIVEAAASAYTLIRRTNYSISGTYLTPNTTTAGYSRATGTALDYSVGTNYIKIIRVVGYE